VRCPQCDSEYVDGIVDCAECGVPLVDAPRGPSFAEPVWEPVEVFSSGAADLIAIAKSILMDAGIEFIVKGEHVQDLFGYGRFPGTSNVIVGPVRIFVAPEAGDDARVLLAGLSAPGPVTDALAGRPDEESGEPAASFFWRNVRVAMKVTVWTLLGRSALGLVWGLLFNLIYRGM